MTEIQRDQAAFGEIYTFGNTVQVPGAGTLQLLGPGGTLAGARKFAPQTITSASIQVDTADPARVYNLSIRVNGAEVATLELPAGDAGANTDTLSVPLGVTDVVTAFLVKTSGPGGPSVFSKQYATVGK